jgi:hypothetical protein
MKQTAVEWFEKELQKNFNIEGVQPLYDDIFKQAKEMEKQIWKQLGTHQNRI